MEEIAKADIFFIITSIATGIIALLMIVLSVYVIIMIRRGSKIIKIVKDEINDTARDFHDIRTHIKDTTHNTLHTIEVEQENVIKKFHTTTWKDIAHVAMGMIGDITQASKKKKRKK